MSVQAERSDISYFVYKTNLTYNQYRLLTAFTIISVEKLDGKELEGLIALIENAWIMVGTVVSDSDYSEKGNLSASKMWFH